MKNIVPNYAQLIEYTFKAIKELGIKSDDTIIIHSSLKSFGYVDGGAEAVIGAFITNRKKGSQDARCRLLSCFCTKQFPIPK